MRTTRTCAQCSAQFIVYHSLQGALCKKCNHKKNGHLDRERHGDKRRAHDRERKAMPPVWRVQAAWNSHLELAALDALTRLGVTPEDIEGALRCGWEQSRALERLTERVGKEGG